jgi:hypothetical protein
MGSGVFANIKLFPDAFWKKSILVTEEVNMYKRLTRAHVVSTATSERLRYLTLARKTEVGKEDRTITGEKHVLRLEVTMVNVFLMAMVDGIEKLNECLLDEPVIF